MTSWFSPTRSIALLFCAAQITTHANAAPCGRETLAALREQQAVLDRLQSQMAPDVDAGDAPQLNLAPPQEPSLPAGVAPSAITDAAARAAYQSSLDANRLKAERHGRQSDLRREYGRALERLLRPATLRCLAASSKLDARTARLLRDADEVIPVLSQPNALALIARLPSRRSNPGGYCDAGTEDHLILLSYAHQRIIFQDDFLLQSCLQSIVLDSDHGDDIVAALTIDQRRPGIDFKWLTNPDDRGHRLTITKGKFVLDQALK